MRTLLMAGLLAAVVTPAAAEPFALTEGVDMKAQAQAAVQDGKRLMVMYVSDTCETCDDLRTSEQAKALASSFHTAAVDLSQPYTMTCPDGLQLGQGEFAEMKSIGALPALIVHDGDGNMVNRLEGVASANELALYARYIAEGNTGPSIAFKRWAARNGQALAAK